MTSNRSSAPSLSRSAETGDSEDVLNNPTLLAFTVEGALLDRRPEIVTAIVRATLEAAELAKVRRREALRVIAGETALPEELVEVAYGEVITDRLTPELSDSFLDRLDRQTDFLLKNGFIARRVPHAEWVEPRPLQEASRLSAQASGKGRRHDDNRHRHPHRHRQ